MCEYGEAHLAAVAGTTEHHYFHTLDQLNMISTKRFCVYVKIYKHSWFQYGNFLLSAVEHVILLCERHVHIQEA